MRSFIAIELPDGFADETAALARALSAGVRGRFVPRGSYHVTLAFLGDVDEALAREAASAVDEAAREAGPVPLEAIGLGTLGPRSDALCLALHPDPALMAACSALRGALTRRSVPFDGRAFRPHVTVARRAVLPERPLAGLSFPRPARARSLALFKSTLTPEGAVYERLHAAPLAG